MLNGLSIFGNVNQKLESNAIRFLASKQTNLLSSVWYSLKQDIDNGFEMNCSFKYRRGINPIAVSGSLPNNIVIPSRLDRNRSDFVSANIICFVIQNVKDIQNWKKKGPLS